MTRAALNSGEAEEHCRQLIGRHPDFAIGSVTLADGWLREAYRGQPDRAKVQHAIDLLQQALAHSVKDATEFDLPSRLEHARELLSK